MRGNCVGQTKFSTRSRGWTEVCEQPSLKPKIKARREHHADQVLALSASEMCSSLSSLTPSDVWMKIRNHSLFEDLLTAAICNLTLTLNASTLSSMAEFFMDDIASPPLPMKVSKAIDKVRMHVAAKTKRS